MVVHYNKATCKSGRLLNERLTELGYNGEPIIWGRDVNKREHLLKMQRAGVPVPTVTLTEPDYKAVGRPDHHSQGKHFYMSTEDSWRGEKPRPTHWLRWIEAAKEFRVHIVDGQVIKLQEKHPIGNFQDGVSYFSYPEDFKYKKSLKHVALWAIEVVGMDFGAVDILYQGDTGQFYVTEINSAPALTAQKSTTLERYAQAFMLRSSDPLVPVYQWDSIISPQLYRWY